MAMVERVGLPGGTDENWREEGSQIRSLPARAAFLSGPEEWREKGGRKGGERVEERGRKKTVGWERKGRKEERGETGGVESWKGGGGWGEEEGGE